MTFQQRLECPHSYADDTPNLKCEIGDTVCDGTLYECCLWDKSFSEQMGMIKESET